MTQTYAAGQTLTAEAVNAELAFPTGAMLPYAGASAPTQTVGGVSAWLLCDGTAVSRTTYAALFTALGGPASPYGLGDGSATFNLPDLRGRVPMGAGTGAQNGGSGSGAISGGTALTARARGAFGGDERMPVHSHDIQRSNVAAASVGTDTSVVYRSLAGTGATYTQTQSAGSGGGDNMPPFIVTNYLIKT